MPFTFDYSPPVSDEQTRRRVAVNQTLLRRVNEGMRHDETDALVPFRCECGQLGCNELICLSPAEYDAVRAHPRRFAIVPSHEVVELETAVERHDRYAVVEVRDPVGTGLAERTDPRADA